MLKEFNAEADQLSETPNFVVYGQSTTAQYINFLNENSLIPSSFDQVIKNNLIVCPVELQLPKQTPQTPLLSPVESPIVGYSLQNL
jgi:hypothetical protein